MSQMTDAEYVDKSGLVCPYCKSKDVSAGDYDVDSTSVSVDVQCHSCKKRMVRCICFSRLHARYSNPGITHETHHLRAF